MSRRTMSEKSPWIETQHLDNIIEKTGNLYSSINVIANRSKQLANNIKEELNGKLEEFASSIDNLEEVHENREQIEISKYYEKLPHPTILAMDEFLEEDTYYRFKTEQEVAADEAAAKKA